MGYRRKTSTKNSVAASRRFNLLLAVMMSIALVFGTNVQLSYAFDSTPETTVDKTAAESVQTDGNQSSNDNKKAISDVQTVVSANANTGDDAVNTKTDSSVASSESDSLNNESTAEAQSSTKQTDRASSKDDSAEPKTTSEKTALTPASVSGSTLTLDATDSSAAANCGFTWSMSGGVLTVFVPTDETYQSYFTDATKIASTLSIPSTMGGLTVSEIVANTKHNFISEITTLQYPKTITIMQNVTTSCLPNHFPALTDFEFTGDGDISLTTIGYRRLPYYAQFPSTLVRFNAGYVDGKYYDVVLPDSLQTVKSKAFQGISSTSVYIPSSVTSFPPTAFSGCTSLTTVTNASNVWAGFSACSNIKNYTALGTYTEISGGACAGWTKLENFEVASTIASIGVSAFQDCTALKSFIIDGNQLLTIGDKAFYGDTLLTALTLPESVTSVGAGAFANSSIQTVNLPNSITNIGAGAFANCGVSKVTLPASLFSTVSTNDFTGEPLYGKVVVGRTAPLFVLDSVITGTNSTLTDVDLMAYQQSFLPSYMFAGCTGLTKIAIPKTVSNLMAGTFLNCSSLKDVYFYGDPTGISIYQTQKVTHPLGYDYIAAGSFSVPNGLNAETGGQDFKTMTGLNIYGLGFSDGNNLKTYAEANGCTFIPYAFIGDGGSSSDVQAKFGYSIPTNTLDASNVDSGNTPVFTVGYTDSGISRTLKPGTDCTVSYTLNGQPVTDTYTPGTYTATITGDSASVWGTATATFTVASPAVTNVTVTGDAGALATGCFYGPNVPAGSSIVLKANKLSSGDAYKALVAAEGSGDLAGVFSAVLLVDGIEVHDGFGRIDITFPVDSQYDNHNATLYHLHNNGSIASQSAVIKGSRVSVSVTDLSSFAIEANGAVASGTTDSGTSSSVASVTADSGTSSSGSTVGTATVAGYETSGSQASPASTGDVAPILPLACIALAALAMCLGAIRLRRSH